MIDYLEIDVKAGDGGDGIIAFRREKFVPFGGPSGGNGGSGGDLILRASPEINDLRALRRRGLFCAGNGEDGGGKGKHGSKGKALVIDVPLGTVISSDGEPLVDLEQPGQQVVVAKGGKGGWGNAHYTTSTNQAPRIAQKGEAGERKRLTLELRLIADVGIIGYPNVGKSSLLAAASAAKPEIADYPFTTREPILGVVEIGAKSFTLAEIPGLIAGAHLGRGLGHDFLRHALRTRVFIHLVDGTSSSPVEDMVQVNNELNLFDRALAEKPQLVAVNKIDIPEVQARLTEIKDAFWEAGIDAVFVSAVTKQGVPELMLEALRLLERVTPSQKAVREEPVKVFRPQPRGGGIKVRKEGEEFVLEAPNIERMMQGLDLENSEVRYMIERQLSRPGVKQALVRAGVKMGDKVRCGKFEWLWSGK